MSDNAKNKKSTRHEERVEAFYLLFEQLFQKDNVVEILIEDAKDARDAEIGVYTRTLVAGVEEKREELENVKLLELDKIIEANLKGWKLRRLSRVSLTILRMAVYEMLYVDAVPVSVAINEAVEIAKEYATPADGAFVNGVLGSVAKQTGKSGEE